MQHCQSNSDSVVAKVSGKGGFLEEAMPRSRFQGKRTGPSWVIFRPSSAGRPSRGSRRRTHVRCLCPRRKGCQHPLPSFRKTKRFWRQVARAVNARHTAELHTQTMVRRNILGRVRFPAVLQKLLKKLRGSHRTTQFRSGECLILQQRVGISSFRLEDVFRYLDLIFTTMLIEEFGGFDCFLFCVC